MRNKPVLLAVSGVKNSGKTTLIERLLPLLGEKGIKTAVIKHDGHSFTPDTEGTDSRRFFAAGAFGTAVFDGEKFSLSKRAAVTETDLTCMFPEAELILLEGFKESRYPKIELVRKGVSEVFVTAPETCLAYVSELELETEKPVFNPKDIGAIAAFVASFAEGGGINAG